jgi:hypothetical protein
LAFPLGKETLNEMSASFWARFQKILVMTRAPQEPIQAAIQHQRFEPKISVKTGETGQANKGQLQEKMFSELFRG